MLLRALAAEGHNVSLVAFAEPAELGRKHQQLAEICREIELVPLPTPVGSSAQAYRDRLRVLVSPLPYGVHRFRSVPMERAVQTALRRGTDCLLCDDIYNLKNVGDPGTLPLVLNKHDVTHVILRRFLRYEGNPLKRAYGWAEYAKLRRWEAHACASVRGLLACSAEDRRVLQALVPAARVGIAPNVIDVDTYEAGPETEPASDTVLYVGSMDWYPNLDAVEFFVGQILPALRQRVPNVCFRVAGRSPAEAVRRRLAAVPGVEFTGTVPDMRVEIARANVCVVPLRIGSGTRLKILEAGAMKRAVVSTRIGAEGLDFVDQEDIVLADEPQAFAEVTARLLGDPARRRKLGAAARVRVEREFSIGALRTAVRQVLPHLLGMG
jgi:polysaccharide biosynthesis protein PslH